MIQKKDVRNNEAHPFYFTFKKKEPFLIEEFFDYHLPKKTHEHQCPTRK